MKKNLVYLLCVIALITSCSPAYKTSQTPDDVYYSPGQKVIAADQYETYNSTSSGYNSTSPDDNYLRMKVRDNSRWSTIDDYDYWYDSRYYANNYYSPWTPSLSLGIGYSTYYPYYSYNPYMYNSWHSWYSPNYTVVYYKNPSVYYKPVSKYNLSTYSNKNYNNYNMPMQSHSRGSMYNNSNSSVNRTRSSDYYQNSNNNNTNSTRSSNSSGGSSMSSGSRISGGGSRTRP